MQRKHPSSAADVLANDGSAIVKRLEHIRRVIEDRFVAAGEILLISLDGTGDLIGSLETLAKTFDAKIATATRADLTVAAAKLCMLPACHAKRVEAVSRLNRSRTTLAQYISTMRCSLAFLAAFTRQAKLMADTVTGTNVPEIADAIAGCIVECGNELRALEDDLAVLQRDLGRVAAQSEVLGPKIADLLPAVPDELTAAARIVSGHHTAVAAAAGQAAVIARNIQERVTRILAALQIGDITRQRIEHVQACLIKAEADAALQPRQTRQRFKATCYVPIAMQLLEIDADFEREITEIERTTAEMATDAEELLRLHAEAFDCAEDRRSGFLHTLSTRIAGAIALVATIEASDKAITETGRATVAVASKLSARIDRFQALRDDMDAIIRHAAHPPSHQPLAIITTEIRAHCRLMGETARVGLATLDTLLHLAGAIALTGQSERALDGKVAAAASALTIAASRIGKARDITETNVAQVAAKGEAVVDMLSLSGARLSLRQEIGEILLHAARDAARHTEGAYDIGDELPEALIHTLTDIAGHYSMARERSIHQAFLDQLAITFVDAERTLQTDDTEAILF